jgi:hypothetical protein
VAPLSLVSLVCEKKYENKYQHSKAENKKKGPGMDRQKQQEQPKNQQNIFQREKKRRSKKDEDKRGKQ